MNDELARVKGTNFLLSPNIWDFNKEPLGLLCVWEGPDPDSTYSVGVDTSDGVGEDRSSIQVNRTGTSHRPDELVAEWTSCVNPHVLPPIIYAICRMYSTSCGEALLGIECNRGDGIAIQDSLMTEYGYGNLYIRTSKDTMGRTSRRYGWRTDANNKGAIWTRGIQHIKDHKWRINSPWFLDELADFGYNPIRQEASAIPGAHDDRLMAGFIALAIGKDWLSQRDLISTVEQEVEKKEVPEWNPQALDISAEEAENMGNVGGWLNY